jgi:hypothetical protein
MVRHFTTTLLMMVFLASQLAVVPHSHGAICLEQHRGHDARPHIHVSWFGQAEHAHGEGHTHHQECGGSQCQPSLTDSDSGHDHDSDAVYLPNDAGDSLPTKCVIAPDNIHVVALLGIALTPTRTAISESWAVADFHDKCSSGCPLYLALRALRI